MRRYFYCQDRDLALDVAARFAAKRKGPNANGNALSMVLQTGRDSGNQPSFADLRMLKMIKTKIARKIVPEEAPSSNEKTSRDRARKKRTKMIAKHLAQRDLLWPDAEPRVWKWSESKGYVHIPRLIPLVMKLIKSISPKQDPSLVYLELWTRCIDGGFFEVDDEEACAYAAGYTGQRSVRTWRERMRKLRDLGFIEVKPSGNREFGSILIINPLQVCVDLKNAKKVGVTDAWWTAFISRAKKISAVIPSATEIKERP